MPAERNPIPAAVDMFGIGFVLNLLKTDTQVFRHQPVASSLHTNIACYEEKRLHETLHYGGVTGKDGTFFTHALLSSCMKS